jgi:replicative DNA helicase
MQDSAAVDLSWVERIQGNVDEFWRRVQKGQKGWATGFRRLDDALCGLQPGFHVIAGESNHGKSAFLTQLAWQVATRNTGVHVMDITIDDSEYEKYCRLLALLAGVEINTVKRYNQAQLLLPEVAERIENAWRQVREAAWRYEVVDGTSVGDINRLGELIHQRLLDIRALPEPLELAVFIDSFHDVAPDEDKDNGLNPYEYTAKAISDLANQYNIAIVCTAELKKLGGHRRPIVDDIRESVKIRYKAKSILLCYNEVSARGEDAEVYYERTNREGKFPILELQVAKNKFNSFKGRLCFEFWPELALVAEPNDADHAQYLKMIKAKAM